MKIGIDCRDLLAGSLNGIGRFVGNLLRAISLEESPPELFLYGNQHTRFDVPDPWGAPLRAHARRKAEAAAWWWDRVTLPRMARRDKLDVFLSPYFKAPGIRSCPLVITIHDLLFLRMPPEVSGRSAIYCRAFRTLAAGFAKRADAVLTVSEHSQRDIVELLRVPKKKTHVVGNCVGPGYRVIDHEAQMAAAKQACGIGGEYILYVGNFGPHKNVDGLLRTYAALDGELRGRFRLVLAGRHDRWTPKVTDAAGHLGIEGRVSFPGHVAEKHLPALYAGAAAFATLSRWEGFGLPALEAMACGTPVMCSDRTALPEVVGDAALLVDPDDAGACAAGLTKILTDGELRARLRARGPAQAKRFSPERFAARVLKVLAAASEARQ
ncbi:MAG: glycosyltransferase family 1 protein [Planctomycetota bacterium]